MHDNNVYVKPVYVKAINGRESKIGLWHQSSIDGRVLSLLLLWRIHSYAPSPKVGRKGAQPPKIFPNFRWGLNLSTTPLVQTSKASENGWRARNPDWLKNINGIYYKTEAFQKYLKEKTWHDLSTLSRSKQRFYK